MVGSGLFTIVAAMIVAIAQSGFVLSSFAGKTSSDNRTGKLNAEAHRSRRDVIISSASLLSFCLGGSNAVAVNPDMDVNNALGAYFQRISFTSWLITFINLLLITLRILQHESILLFRGFIRP